MKCFLTATFAKPNREATPSEIYMDFGYDNLSNFSTAFKNEFGYSPKNVMKT